MQRLSSCIARRQRRRWRASVLYPPPIGGCASVFYPPRSGIFYEAVKIRGAAGLAIINVAPINTVTIAPHRQIRSIRSFFGGFTSLEMPRLPGGYQISNRVKKHGVNLKILTFFLTRFTLMLLSHLNYQFIRNLQSTKSTPELNVRLLFPMKISSSGYVQTMFFSKIFKF
jgi:hypothetical protein